MNSSELKSLEIRLQKINDNFDKHAIEDARNFQIITNHLNDIDAKREQRHQQVMEMLKPINDAFTFKNKLGVMSTSAIKNTAIMVGALLSFIALGKIIWEFIIQSK